MSNLAKDLERVELTEIETLKAQLAEQQAINAKLTAKKTNSMSIKVSQKGAVSVYGMGRFPVTLYRSQWEKLFSIVDDIKSFIEENKAKLSEK